MTEQIEAVAIIPLNGNPGVIDTLNAFSDCEIVLLLDSAARVRPRDARYSFLTADPVEVVRLNSATFGSDPFQELRRLQKQLPNCPEHLPPFVGGIAGLMSYELGQAFERIPSPAVDEFQTPALFAGLFDWCIVWDHIRSTVDLFVIQLNSSDNAVPTPANVAGTANSKRRQSERIQWVQQKLSDLNKKSAEPGASRFAEPGGTSTSLPDTRSKHEQHLTGPPTSANSISSTLHRSAIESSPWATSSFSESEYLRAVARVVEYIRAGDIFQANLSQQLIADWHGTPEQLYERVRRLNPAPFCSLLKAPDFSIVSASPERFLRTTDGRFVETRPIKGTRRRQSSPIADLFTSDELRASEKDRAENVMIVDLLRNDLSRNCRAGSVQVTGLCEIELFETVQHLVSTVVGELLPDRDVWQLLSGSFPGGSITGAPKIRAMEIIAELEPTVRGAYCGCMFYLGPRSDFDSSILIRTFTLKNQRLQFPVGGGIVADSEPADEYRETLHKASGMLRVLSGSSEGRRT
ncbi:MAG: anthranilate synthase component I family protein [Planctomyces sp.]|nr:anthranilate synthase component I family protein [Planctomyces sp.]